MKFFSTIILLSLLFVCCNSPFTPKPKGYFKIEVPEKNYIRFNLPGYPYSFEYPTYATITKDTSFFGETPENPWWINIDFPSFNGKIYVSYKDLGKYQLSTVVNDAFNMTNNHAMKAYAIKDSAFVTDNKISGVLFSVEGNVATASQFFLTDSTKHFLRGALYFDATPNQDSLKPVQEFLLVDMKHIINTFKWN